MLKKILVGAGALVVVLALSFAGFVFWTLQPRPQDLALPASLIAVDSEAGQEMLANANANADLAALKAAWQSQELGSWCGVASGTIAVNALGGRITQDELFSPGGDDVKGKWEVTFGGMTLTELAALLRSHGLAATVHHAEEMNVDSFRDLLVRNLESESDLALVNYHRTGVDQVGPGHISPVGAYDETSDRFLVMDTASYRYPWVWVEAKKLFAAANTTDSSSGKSRGLVLVGRGG